MISKSAIQEFLRRPLADYRQFKSYTYKRLWREVRARFGTAYSPKLMPLKCQLVGMRVAMECPTFLFYYDPGLGKSKLVLDLIETLRAERKVRRALVLVENLVNIDNFAEEARLHTSLQVLPLYGSSAERARALQRDLPPLTIINYAGLCHLLSDRQRQGHRSRLVVNVERAREFAKRFDLVVYDEVQNAKDHRSLTFRVCRVLSKYIPYRYGLTGTPFGRNPMDVWAQFYLIDHGETLGRHIGLYREAFFTKHVHPWGGWVRWEFDQRKYSTWVRLLANRSLSYTDEEVHDLPEVHSIRVPIGMDPTTRTYYESAIKTLRATDLKDKQQVKQHFQAIRQLASCYVRSGREAPLDLPNRKLDWIESALREFPAEDKIVIFHDFIHSGDRIEQLLRRMGIKYARIYGATEDKRAEQHRFKRDPRCRVLIANLKSGGVGLNLQMANRVIYYELPLSLITYRQSLKRCHRMGQRKRTYLYYLLTRHTVEETLERYLERGANLLQAVMRGKVKL